MSLEQIRGLDDYHRWANHRLFEIALERGEEAVERDMGPEWSRPSIRRMFGHIYGADAVWLGRWKRAPLPSMPGDDIPSMRALRQTWDGFEAEQRAYLDALSEADLARVLHHRSEINTMLTLISGSPPDTGVNSFILATGGRGSAWA